MCFFEVCRKILGKVRGRKISFLVYENKEEKYQKLYMLLQDAIGRADMEEAPIHRISTLEDGISYLKTESVEAVFVSLEDKAGQGMVLANQIREYAEFVNIIAMAEEPVYMMDCWKIHVSGYIHGELSQEKVLDELEHLKFPVHESERI